MPKARPGIVRTDDNTVTFIYLYIPPMVLRSGRNLSCASYFLIRLWFVYEKTNCHGLTVTKYLISVLATSCSFVRCDLYVGHCVHVNIEFSAGLFTSQAGGGKCQASHGSHPQLAKLTSNS